MQHWAARISPAHLVQISTSLWRGVTRGPFAGFPRPGGEEER